MTQQYNNNLTNAERIFNLAIGTYTLQDIKAIYRKLAKDNHPDHGGSVEMMQLINTAWSDFGKYFITYAEYIVREATDEHNITFIAELQAMQGVTIEIVGYWVWLTGNTILYKDSIKGLGFMFSGSKKAWYWSPSLESKRKYRGTASLSKIRNKYGSTIIETTGKATHVLLSA
jgi:hypothetical protein